MSKGNPILQVRVPAELLRQVESSIHSANLARKDRPYDLSSWIRHAIVEKLEKLKRSKKPKRPKTTADGGCNTPPVSDAIASALPEDSKNLVQASQLQEAIYDVLLLE